MEARRSIGYRNPQRRLAQQGLCEPCEDGAGEVATAPPRQRPAAEIQRQSTSRLNPPADHHETAHPALSYLGVTAADRTISWVIRIWSRPSSLEAGLSALNA